MFIVLEGIDSCGKSTVGNLLAKELNGFVYKTPPKEYRLMRRRVDCKPGTHEHYNFYREAVIQAESEIKEHLSQGKVVICDRYWLSTVVYHKVGKLAVSSEYFEDLLQPDLTVLLHVSGEKQVIRQSNKVEDNIGNIRGFQDEITKVFLLELAKIRTPFIVIQTDKILPEQSVQIIKNSIPQP